MRSLEKVFNEYLGPQDQAEEQDDEEKTCFRSSGSKEMDVMEENRHLLICVQ